MIDLDRKQLDMLYRVACAEFFTSPSEPAGYNVAITLRWLTRRGLIYWDNGQRLTASGRAELERQLDAEKLGTLARMRARRELARSKT